MVTNLFSTLSIPYYNFLRFPIFSVYGITDGFLKKAASSPDIINSCYDFIGGKMVTLDPLDYIYTSPMASAGDPGS